MVAPSTLVLAWGNPGRLDDGLGPAFARALSAKAMTGVTVTSDYQLQIENAADLASYSRVVLVDADRAGSGPFRIRALEPADSGLGFSTHSVTPAALLALARDLFGAEPEAWLVGIRGYEFDDFGEALSERAQANLASAITYIEDALQSNDIRETGARRSPQTIDANL